MRRSHRTWHRLIWLTLAPILTVGLFGAIRLRSSLLQVHDSAPAAVRSAELVAP